MMSRPLKILMFAACFADLAERLLLRERFTFSVTLVMVFPRRFPKQCVMTVVGHTLLS